MNRVKSMLTIAVLATVLFTIQSCNDKKTENTNATKQSVENGKEHTFACPMHPEITGMEGDKCSKCGMDLTLMSNDDHKGHKR